MGDRGKRRRITATDVAEAAGVSRATVGFVLNRTPGQTISARTRQRVLDAAATLGYRPDRAAQALARGGCRVVLFLLPDWSMDVGVLHLLEEAARVLTAAGYSSITYVRHRMDPTRPLWELVNPEVAVSIAPLDSVAIGSLRAGGITKIFPDPANPAHCGGLAFAAAGARSQIEYLHAMGHRRIGFAATADPSLTALNELRLESASRTAFQLGLPEPHARVVDHRDDTGTRAVRAWTASDVTAVAAYNDDVAATVVGAALRAGLRVPGDMSVLGHDDSSLASMFLPTLSSVRVNPAGLGSYLAEEALRLADGRPLTRAAPETSFTVIRRESTAAYAAGP